LERILLFFPVTLFRISYLRQRKTENIASRRDSDKLLSEDRVTHWKRMKSLASGGVPEGLAGARFDSFERFRSSPKKTGGTHGAGSRTAVTHLGISPFECSRCRGDTRADFFRAYRQGPFHAGRIVLAAFGAALLATPIARIQFTL
jgi:hypothetical protein